MLCYVMLCYVMFGCYVTLCNVILCSVNGHYFIIVVRLGTSKQQARWRIGRVDAFCPECRGFESCSSRHVGTLDKSFTYKLPIALWRANSDTVSIVGVGSVSERLML